MNILDEQYISQVEENNCCYTKVYLTPDFEKFWKRQVLARILMLLFKQILNL